MILPPLTQDTRYSDDSDGDDHYSDVLLLQPTSLNSSPVLVRREQCVETCRGAGRLYAVVNSQTSCHCLDSTDSLGSVTNPYNCIGNNYMVTT